MASHGRLPISQTCAPIQVFERLMRGSNIQARALPALSVSLRERLKAVRRIAADAGENGADDVHAAFAKVA